MNDNVEKGQADKDDPAPCWWCQEHFTLGEDIIRFYGEDELLLFHPDHYEPWVRFIERIRGKKGSEGQ